MRQRRGRPTLRSTGAASGPTGRRALLRGAAAAALVPALGGGLGCASRQGGDHASSGELDEPIGDLLRRGLPGGVGATVLAARGSEVLSCQGFGPPSHRPLTAHQLLSHTSGLPEFLPKRYGDDYAPLSRAELLKATATTELGSRPGETFHYSNLGYSLLAAVVEIRSGRPYEDYLAERLLSPAGLRRTGYVRPRWRTSAIAVEYEARGRPAGRPDRRPRAPDGPYWNLRGNGGLLSTAPGHQHRCA
ncbi:serine hydrolase domain-containing protein [Streptomyces spectabilis]|uniref:Beta-lactamase family protein n=1 Tax=Streptomyces spectabilis TaxID=68270 RepID=A0A516RIB8_STRST|nr:serine hydrolase domain-containing protein [Streptomyces spectabilis]QDQ15406.1 beta-lactamase family protein [Streptomyces spectabilis]